VCVRGGGGSINGRSGGGGIGPWSVQWC
jgi:hypothetical protein